MERKKSWHSFAWSWVWKLRKSPKMLPSLPGSLVSLSLAECNLSNDSFPKDFSNLLSLRFLDLSRNPILCLPDSVGNVRTLKKLYLNSCKSLKNVLGLPSVELLDLGDSPLLQRITYKSTHFRSTVYVSHCDDLDEIKGLFKLEPIGEVDIELINSLGWFDVTTLENLEVNLYSVFSSSKKKRHVQVLSEDELFNTFFPGKEVPGWCSDKRMGSSISFVVPSLPDNLKIQGLNFCCVYSNSNKEEEYSGPPLFYTEIRNKTKDFWWRYDPLFYGIPEADEDLIWLSHREFPPLYDSPLESGDLIDVKIVVGDCFQVKECGIGLVHDRDYENYSELQSSSLRDMPSGDLSSTRVFQHLRGASINFHVKKF